MAREYEIEKIEEKPKDFRPEREDDRELADIVYIFYSKEKQGIKFYDHSPYGPVAKLTGFLPEGQFKTEMHAISLVNWNDEVNKENTTELHRVKEGSVKIKTIMVSEEKFMEIADQILKQQNSDRIIIDINEKKIEKKLDYNEIFSLNNNLNFNKEQYNNIDANKNNISGESNSFKK